MYGYADDPIAAQVQLYQYAHASDVGELDSLGDYLDTASTGSTPPRYGWVGEAITGATSLIGMGIGMASAGKQSRDQQRFMDQQAELLADQDRLLEKQVQIEAAKTKRLVMGLGFLALAGGVGITIWQWPKISKKLGRR